MSEATNMAVLGAAGAAAVAGAGFLARSLLWDPIKELRASSARQGKRLGRLGERMAVLESRLGVRRTMTDPEGAPIDDNHSGRVR